MDFRKNFNGDLTISNKNNPVKTHNWEKIPELFYQGTNCRWERSKHLDKYFGYKISKIENRLLKKYRAFDKDTDDSSKKKHYGTSQVWVGLNPQYLQTPYSDLHWLFLKLKKFSPATIVDLGSGYGRAGLVLSMTLPDSTFIGVEILKERYTESLRIFQKFGLSRCKLFHQNLTEKLYVPPSADVYIIYDFSHVDDIDLVIQKVFNSNSKKAFIIAAIGDRINYLIGHGNYCQAKWHLIDSGTNIRIFRVEPDRFKF